VTMMEDLTYLILVSSPRVKGLNHRLILDQQVTDELQHYAQVIDRQLRAQLTQEGWFETEELIACATMVQQDGGRSGLEIIAIHGVYAPGQKAHIRATIKTIKSRVVDYITDPDLLATAKHRLVVSYPFPSIGADLDRVYTRPLPRFDYAREPERSSGPAPEASSDTSQSRLKIMMGFSTLVMIVVLGVIAMLCAGDEDAQDGLYILESLEIELEQSCLSSPNVTSLNVILNKEMKHHIGLKLVSGSFKAEPTPQVKFQYVSNHGLAIDIKMVHTMTQNRKNHNRGPDLIVQGNFKLKSREWTFSPSFVGEHHQQVNAPGGIPIDQCYANIIMSAKKSP